MDARCVDVNKSPAALAELIRTQTVPGGSQKCNNNGSPSARPMASGAKQMTIPNNGGVTSNNGLSSSSSAAAADASAMPPPPPATPGLLRTTASTTPSTSMPSPSVSKTAHVSVLNASARAPPAASLSMLRAPITATKATPSAVPSSNNIATAKLTMGIPSPLAKAPLTTGVAVRPSAVARPTEQRLLSGNYAHLAKRATPISVPSPVASQSARPAVPQPVLSSAHSVSTTARVATHLGQQQQQQRVVPKYLAKAPAPSTISSMSTMKRVVGTTPTAAGTKPLINGGRLVVPKPTMTSSSIVKQPVQSSTPSPAAALHRPSTVNSGVTHVSHHVPIGASPSMPPPPQESISTSSGGSSGGSSSKKKSGHPLRRGKWTSEEEAYANRLINEFKAGLLPLTDGTTLRNFLSKLLNCDPMRISKKFVGNNCIGKQVFRRRVADINRLTADQIQQMRVELSELERRFFDRVAQTNRVKTPGVSATMTAGPVAGVPANTTINIINVSGGKVREEIEMDRPPTPPWLRPPASYKPKGKFAEKLKAKMVVVPPASQQIMKKVSVSATPPLVEVKSDTEKAMDAIQRSGSSLDRLAQAAANEEIPRTESALEQLARTASAAKFVEDIVNGDNSVGETQVDGGKKLSQTSLQGSFEALMSMDIQSVENLVELASSSNSSALLAEINKSSSDVSGKNNQSSANLSSRMESFIKSLSSANLLKAGLDSTAALGSLLNATSSNSIFDAEKFAKRVESMTGFSQLRAEDGLATGSHNSVDDFLSLVASGDIPHQDPNMLKVPLQKVMQQNGVGPKGSKRKFSQQQLAALASRLTGSTMSLTEMSCGGSALKKRKKK